MANEHWIGVDLGGTKILTGVFDAGFRLLNRAKLPTPSDSGPAAVFGQIGKAVDEVLRDSGVRPEQVAGLGMGLPGPVDPRSGQVRLAPNLGWKDLAIAPHLPKGWTWPTVAENDVKVGTYGEYLHGAAKGARIVLGVFAGTGVGGGIILNGEIYSGFNFNAGEVGHVVLNWRKGTTLEQIAGRRNVLKRADNLLADAPKRVRRGWRGLDLSAMKSSQLADLYQSGDPIALQVVDDAARALGVFLGSAINLLSPEVIVIGGGMAGALGESFLERVWEIAQRFTLPRAAEGVRCLPAALGDNSGIYGAAALARAKVAARGEPAA
jgi:glucokinase